MIVFQHDHIIQSDAMVLSSSYFYCPFFQQAEIGSCFSGIKQFCRSAFQQLNQVLGFGGNTAHALHAIKYQSFAGKNGAGRALYRKSYVFRFNMRSISNKYVHLQARVILIENFQR